MPDAIPRLSIREVVDESNLANVTYFELHAVTDDNDVTPPAGEAELHLSQEMSYGFRDDDHGFRVRIRTVIRAPGQGDITVGLSAEWDYTGTSARAIHQELMLEFINGVAIMVLFPYLRESAADLSRRVFGSALLIPTIQRGQVEFLATDLDSSPATGRTSSTGPN